VSFSEIDQSTASSVTYDCVLGQAARMLTTMQESDVLWQTEGKLSDSLIAKGTNNLCEPEEGRRVQLR
jgi:hypothetical protein